MEATNDLNYDSYLAHAIEIFNDRMDAGFSGDDIILTEPFPEKWTRKCKKKQNESLIFCEVLVHAA